MGMCKLLSTVQKIAFPSGSVSSTLTFPAKVLAFLDRSLGFCAWMLRTDAGTLPAVTPDSRSRKMKWGEQETAVWRLDNLLPWRKKEKQLLA